MTRLLIVEDDPGIAFALKLDFEAEGWAVVTEFDGQTAFDRARAEPFDLILLDVMLPRKSGFDICRELRRAGVKTPIIMLTARSQEAEKIMGLEWGADDYVTKPFSPSELRARAKAVLRRFESAGSTRFRFGTAEIDFDRCEVFREGALVELTALEFKLLAAFVQNRGKMLSRERLLDLVWGRTAAVTDRVVDNHILTLRKKIEPEPASPRFLVSVRGLGYRFDA
jgi:two-component system alkaline phosphatase synthesis response regulator PhoP